MHRFALLAVLLTTSVAAHADDARTQLTAILSCNTSASPAKVESLIKSLGGHTLLREAPQTDVEYTLPNAVEVFSQKITQIAVHPWNNTDGDFTEYRSLFTGRADTVARYASITSANGAYQRHVGNNDLTLRFEPGGTYIVCANGVRSIGKSIKREWRKVTNEPTPPLN